MWSIHHVNLQAPQLDRTRWFFAELLGLLEGVYAMPGIHQIYTYDPAMNVIELNAQVGAA